MAVPLLDLKAQHATIRDDVVAALMAVVDQQAFILGDPVGQLECSVAGLSQVKFAIGCANGTDAILLALRALGVGQGDEVITTPFTFFATGGAIHNAGARPVFVDIDPRTYNIEPANVTPAITARTKAVIAVDLFGQMAAIEQVKAAAKGLPVIEDAAQSIGASRMVDGRKVMAGEAAAIGTFSFFPSKNLGGYGDGGMMVTQDEGLFEALMKLRTHGSRRTYYHEIVGYNSRLDALQAAVLRAKLPHLESWSAARRRNASYYDAAFADVPEVGTPFVDPANTSIYNQYTIRVGQRDALQAHLKEQGIGSNVYYPLPLHLQPCFAYLGYNEGQCPEAERAAREVLSLPVFPELTTAQLDEVIAAVRGFFGR
ncbi:DegT/DnrJ/EryC1/StrS family aminotransferase [Gemmatimonas phototrophica]|uniref:Pleiotropic regulatory protein n=1 Tax=Gemmatimonas phototrophica TaxID=1379270 RepID=A0A143BKI3_9BACT|nr:DegT/DnrJ/EryC1/StrS family aminotransferase [Gemmatimonas phototrophica]AMW05095.1 Pleiotropic regulatory protein [Gemmatimonas phototrophica]